MKKVILSLAVLGLVLTASAPAEASTLKEKVRTVVSAVTMPVRHLVDATALILVDTAKLALSASNVMDPASPVNVELDTSFNQTEKE